jgi:hypothetical protein
LTESITGTYALIGPATGLVTEKRNIELLVNDRLSEFWHATWAAWRSGQLSSVATIYAQQSAGEYDDFVKSLGDVYPLISSFIATHPPFPEEFHITFQRAGQQLGLMITNRRLWIYNKPKGAYVELNLADIAHFRATPRWNSARVSILMKDNTRQDYEKIPVLPNNQLVARILARGSSPQLETIGSQLAPTQQPRVENPQEFWERPGAVPSSLGSRIACFAGSLACFAIPLFAVLSTLTIFRNYGPNVEILVTAVCLAVIATTWKQALGLMRYAFKKAPAPGHRDQHDSGEA